MDDKNCLFNLLRVLIWQMMGESNQATDQMLAPIVVISPLCQWLRMKLLQSIFSPGNNTTFAMTKPPRNHSESFNIHAHKTFIPTTPLLMHFYSAITPDNERQSL